MEFVVYSILKDINQQADYMCYTWWYEENRTAVESLYIRREGGGVEGEVHSCTNELVGLV